MVNIFSLNFCMFILVKLIPVIRTHWAEPHTSLAQGACCCFPFQVRVFQQPKFLCQKRTGWFGRQSPESCGFPVILAAFILTELLNLRKKKTVAFIYLFAQRRLSSVIHWKGNRPCLCMTHSRIW